MTDLSKRLLGIATRMAYEEDDFTLTDIQTCKQAADELERLTQELRHATVEQSRSQQSPGDS